jgi:hypothetical protein
MWELRADHSVSSQITDRYLMPGTDLEDLFQSRSERVLRTLHANAWATLKLCSRIWIASRAKSEAKSKIIEAVSTSLALLGYSRGKRGLDT